MTTKRLTAALMSLVLLTSAHLTPAHAMIGGVPVADDDEYAHKVVQVGACTGTVIAEHWIISARHCLAKAGSTAYRGLNRPFLKDPNAKIYPIDRREDAPVGDVMLVHTPTPIKEISPARTGAYTTTFGDRGEIFGWGGGTGRRLVKTEAAAVKQRFHSAQEVEHNLVGTYIEAQYVQSGNDLVYPQHGDSGGPLFINGTLVGVLSYTVGLGRPTAHFAALDEVQDWIHNTIKEPAPSLTTPPPTSSSPTSSLSSVPSSQEPVPTTSSQEPAPKPTTQKPTPTPSSQESAPKTSSQQPTPSSSQQGSVPQRQASSSKWQVSAILAAVLGIVIALISLIR
ncbi:S1 family peptidase [Corynebacterium sp. HS2168-gen11]|uniref:S1 family peptidase n=1 Tax=Corynebacterium sp. HS2168-gen11 TaxID=2974027 RepID=UPI00216AB987|nr:S1 family peptidase [Corynebacterium sp. HS2168-gen11]MCS4535547.1 S1 family peptidase [Corynebacterium sp. HS2168-gen11]